MDRRFRQSTKIDTTKIPYAVNRTASGNLPVYTQFRGINRESVTCIASVYGDTKSMIADLRTAVCDKAEISESGRVLEIRGRYAKRVKQWLQSLGF